MSKCHTKKHVLALTSRLREYDRVMAYKKFTEISYCRICDSLPENMRVCESCLLETPERDCKGRYSHLQHFTTGLHNKTKHEQQAQYEYLIQLLDENGYEYK